ncbi:hypothetical protein GF362_03225 [Candidatus Dojkabacteria bacterium]|nr:hypothetical protein [Candidatus Dojkabacteria bacterium]
MTEDMLKNICHRIVTLLWIVQQLIKKCKIEETTWGIDVPIKSKGDPIEIYVSGIGTKTKTIYSKSIN